MGEYSKAIESYEMALPIRRFCGGLVQQGNSFANMGRLYDAIDCYKQALRIDEKDVPL